MEHKLKKINLFIPGAAKSGTSSLHELLKLHPEIDMSKNKEPHFLSSSTEYLRSEEHIETYLSNFDLSKKFKYHGESSTGYFYFKSFKDNFKKIGNPDSKFIIILRNPIDRTLSHYNYLKSLGSENLNLKDAVLNDCQKEPSPLDVLPELIIKNYYQYSLYGKWLTLFYENHEVENIKVILFEDLKSKPLETLNTCFAFLGLHQLETIPDIASNKTVKIRFPKLYRNIRIFAFNESKLRNILKYFLPVKWRRTYKKRITEILLELMKTKKQLAVATAEEREWLFDLYKHDVIKLKQLTGLQLQEWQDFNKL